MSATQLPMCGHKQSYASWAAAERAARAMRHRMRVIVDVYRCDKGRHSHVGTVPPRQTRKATRRPVEEA